MAQATRAPRRGESGFAAHAREHGGDPRLSVRPPEAPEAPPVPPAAARGKGRQGASGRQRAVFEPSTRPLLGGVGFSVNDLSGFVLGLLAWVLALQFLQDPRNGVRNWLRAKFLNKGPGGQVLP